MGDNRTEKVQDNFKAVMASNHYAAIMRRLIMLLYYLLGLLAILARLSVSIWWVCSTTTRRLWSWPGSRAYELG